MNDYTAERSKLERAPRVKDEKHLSRLIEFRSVPGLPVVTNIETGEISDPYTRILQECCTGPVSKTGVPTNPPHIQNLLR